MLLLTLEPSRLLRWWWRGLYGVVAGALLAVAPWIGAAAVLLLTAWARHRPTRTVGLILISGRVFGLPAQGRFGLALLPASAVGGWAAMLVFSDRPRAPVCIYRDQVDSGAWRRLRIAVAESR